MQVTQGLFSLDLVDHHAVLGVPIGADAKQVRKRYLKIARKLHPDSLRSATDDEKQQASELLSKLVNPAYEVLSQEKATLEHQVSLKLKGQQLQRQPNLLAFNSVGAKRVAGSNNLDYDYPNAVSALADDQYGALEQVTQTIGQLSEINAAYVMRQGDAAPATAPSPLPDSVEAPAAPSAPSAAAETTVLSPRERRAQLINSYINRAKEFEYKGNFSRAIIELREAVKAHPQNPMCHAELARMYLRASQVKMANIHCKRALEIDPGNSLAAEVKQKLDAYAKRAQKTTKPAASKKSGKSGGLFGGLFGKKR